MGITSDIYIQFGDLGLINVPVHTDAELQYHSERNLREVYESRSFHLYNLESVNWNLNWRIVDTRRSVLINSGILSGNHDILTIPDGIREYKLEITPIYTDPITFTSHTTTDPLSSVEYVRRDPDDWDIETIYFTGNQLTNGLTDIRKQDLTTEGLAFNVDAFIDQNFSLRQYIPNYMYDNGPAEDLTDYFAKVFGSKFFIVNQLKQFDSIYDNINEYTARRYGVPNELINDDYVRFNVLRHKTHIRDLYYLWSKKGTIEALYGSLKFFANIHPFEAFKEEQLGWFLTEPSGGASYAILDKDTLSFSTNTSAMGSQQIYDNQVVYGVDANETYYATDFRIAVKVNYFIDIFGVKRYFADFSSVSDLQAGYDYSGPMFNALFEVTDNFTPANAKVFYWWVHADSQTRVNLFTTPVGI